MAVTAGKFVGVRDLAVDLTFTDDVSAKYPIGTKVQDEYGNRWIYVKYGATTALGDALKISAAGAGVYTLIPTAAANECVEALAPLAHTANYYGWALYEGVMKGDAKVVSSGVANGDPLGSSSTAGALTIAANGDIGPIRCQCLIDDTDNTGDVKIR